MSSRALTHALALVLLAPALAGLAAEKDRHGDPLPDGATGRLGTTRLRNTSYGNAILSPDAKTLYVSGPGGIRLLDPLTGTPSGKLETQPPGNLAGFSADGTRGVQNNYDSVVVWETASGKTLTKFTGRAYGGVSGVALSADGKVLAVGGSADATKKQPATVTVWDVDASKEIAAIATPLNQYAQAALAPDGKTVAIWGSHYEPGAKPEDQDNSPGRFVYFHDAGTGKQVSKFRCAAYSPQGGAIGPKGLAAIFSGNNTVDLLDPKTGTSKQQLLTRARMYRSLTFSPDGSVLAATADDGAVQMWRVADGARLATVEPPVAGASNTQVRLLDNEKGVAWAVRNLATYVWEVPSGKPLGPTEGHASVVTSIAVTADGKHALTSSDGGGVLRWEPATGKLLGEVPLRNPNGSSPGYAPAAQFSPDGARALVRDSYTSVGVFDLASGTQWYTIPVPSYTNSRETFSADGSKLVLTQVPSDDAKKKPSRVLVFDTASGKRLGEIELPGYSRLSAAVTADGKYLVTAGNKFADKGPEAFVAIGWELATGARKGELTGKSAYYQPQVLTAPDGTVAVVATGDGKVIAFDFLEGKEVRAYDLGKRSHNGQLAAAPDGKRFAVACQPTFGKDTTTAIVVFDRAGGDAVQTITAPGYTPQAMTFTPDGKTLLTSAGDTTVTVWAVGK